MAFYDSDPIWTDGKGRWSIYQLGEDRNGSPKLAVQFDGVNTALVDHPVLHDCGTVAYDRPESIPQRVKSAVNRLYKPRGWFMFFHGGYSYSPFNVHEDKPEFFSSLQDAMDCFWRRTEGFNRRFPCTDETATAWLFAEDPRRTGAEYPDRVISLGARRGIRCEGA